jgi:hypothetical protein
MVPVLPLPITGSAAIGTRRQVTGMLSRLFLDEDHQCFGQNPVVLHGLGGGR